MIQQDKLEQLRTEVSHTSPDAMHKINAAVLADALTELWCWRNGGVTEEMLRAGDGYIKVGRGCIIARECDWPDDQAHLRVGERTTMSDTRPTPPNADVPTSVSADHGENVGAERGACSLPRCEKCGCLLKPVDSNVYKKWHECIRALNTPERCTGTEMHWRDWPFDGRPSSSAINKVERQP